MTTVADVAARLAGQVPTLTVYAHGVPWARDVPAPVDRYAIVRSNGGVRTSDDLAGTQSVHVTSVWVTVVAQGSTSAGASEVEVGARCLWAVQRCQSALVGWRPSAGWRPQHVASQPLTRDDDLPDRTVVYAVDQWSLTGRS